MGCVERPIVRTAVDILIQVLLVFGFLTIFFFTYVSSQEKKIFTKQINILVDDLMDIDVLPGLKKVVKDSGLSAEESQNALNGILSSAKLDATNSSKDAVKEVRDKNAKTEKNAFTALGIFFGFIVVVLVIFKISRTCSDLELSLCISVFIVLFVGGTEFFFLALISSNYVSISPNAVRGQMADAIGSWLKNNKDSRTPLSE